LGITRKWVFPILRLVVFAVIAVALVRLAFFAGTSADDDAAVPTGSITDPEVTVEVGSIVNDVTLQGTVVADAPVGVKATGQGAVDEVFVQQGATVAQGDKLFDIKVETPQDPIETTDPTGAVTVTQPKPVISYAKVFAPIAGTLTSLTVLHGQAVSVGDAAGQVSPPTFSVTGSLSPEQQYRLLDKPTEAQVTITGGPAPFACTGLTIASTGVAEPADPSSGDTTSSSGTSVRCAVPGDVLVFPGLAAALTIPAGKAENVLVVPTTAVDGGAQTGVVYAVTADGGSEPRDVTLGMSDGDLVEVTGGVAEGDTILQFSPSAQAPAEDGCVQGGDGSIICGTVK